MTPMCFRGLGSRSYGSRCWVIQSVPTGDLDEQEQMALSIDEFSDDWKRRIGGIDRLVDR